MTRRIRSPKRKHAGNRTFGYGNKKNNRGKGNKGGHGRAGYHKHKWMHTIKYELEHIRAEHTGFTNPTSKNIPTITLKQINEMCTSKKLPSKNEVFTANFPKRKLLGTGRLNYKVEITVHSASKGAVKKAQEQQAKITTLNTSKKEEKEN